VGCGGGSSDSSDGGSEVDTKPPTVISTSLNDGATEVSPDSSITITFSEDMDASTINPSTFTLNFNPSVPGGVTYDSGTRTATFTPSVNLDNNTTYMATITTGVKDVAGNSLMEDYSWSFMTAATTIGGEFLIGSNMQAGGIAFDGTNYLVAFRSSDNSIGAQLVSKTGSLVGSPISIGSLTYFENYNSHVAYDGTNYLIIWSDAEQIDEPDFYGQFVSKSSTLMGDKIAITTAGTGSEESALAFDGNNYLLVYADRKVHAKFISPGGSVGNDIAISSSDGAEPVVAFDGTNFLAAWYGSAPNGVAGTDSANVYGRFISMAGTTVGSEFVIDASVYKTEGDHTIAFDGTNYLVTFHNWINNELDVFGRLVDTFGNVGTRVTISDESGSQFSPDIVFNGNDYLITWHYFPDWPALSTFTSFGQFFDTSGNAMGSKFPISLLGGNTYILPVRFDDEINKYFAVAITGSFSTGVDLYGVFIPPDELERDWYKDSDGDSYSDGDKIESIEQPAGYFLPVNLLAIDGDCNDDDGNINPGAVEIPNDDIDNDCDGISELGDTDKLIT